MIWYTLQGIRTFRITSIITEKFCCTVIVPQKLLQQRNIIICTLSNKKYIIAHCLMTYTYQPIVCIDGAKNMNKYWIFWHLISSLEWISKYFYRMSFLYVMNMLLFTRHTLTVPTGFALLPSSVLPSYYENTIITFISCFKKVVQNFIANHNFFE